VATGYGGWGMSSGVMSGRLLAALITGEPLPWTDLYDPRRLRPFREAGPLLKAQASVGAHFVAAGAASSDNLGLPPSQPSSELHLGSLLLRGLATRCGR
jgi:hypothetical protein